MRMPELYGHKRILLLPASLVVLGAVMLTGNARAENIVYSANAGVLNVRDPQFGAKGDGKADDTGHKEHRHE